MAFIRPYKPSDWAAAAHICRATLPPSLDRSKVATRLAPYLWTHPFPVVTPQHCFVLDDGSGLAVGYVIGCADVQAMAAAYGRYVNVVSGHEDEAVDIDPAFVAQARVDVGEAPAQIDQLEPWTLDVSTAVDGDRVNETCLKQFLFSPRWLLLDSAHTAAKRALVAGPDYRATMHINLLPAAQGDGWGRRLIETFVASVVAAGARGVHIGISGENTRVVAFYEKCGFRVELGGEAEGSVWMVRDLKE
ncbi:acetyltransferase [Grosmannia clavigera kw1407]|uniref:Acetyltransferase n=1 Tax=Grosmannia clavigera (strain kw1407 / UAMH 11150) TaxID=655863 RepID=F0XP59_GROCL|nr:acetyltransferase [Grosmannia clavigera kw1407]EFX00242.1 acetyltransferase [Grosmannia clavigera kw1407]